MAIPVRRVTARSHRPTSSWCSRRRRLLHSPNEHRVRPAIDPLFRSTAAAYGRRVVGVMFCGALDDGTAGMRAITAHGATVPRNQWTPDGAERSTGGVIVPSSGGAARMRTARTTCAPHGWPVTFRERRGRDLRAPVGWHRDRCRSVRDHS